MKKTPISKEIPTEAVVRTVAEIGQLAHAARKAQNLGQADMAGLNNTGVRFILELEKGKPTLRTQMVLDTLDLLGLEVVIRKKGSRK